MPFGERSYKDLKEYHLDLIDKLICGYVLYKIIKDENGEFKTCEYVEINSSCEKILSINRDSCIGRKIEEVHLSGDYFWMDLLRETINNPNGNKYENVKINGKEYYKINMWCPNEGFISCTFTNITSEIDKIQSLKRSEERYRSLVNNQSVMVVRIDMHGNTTLVNDYYCEKFGIKASEIVGKKFSPEIHPEDRIETRKIMMNLAHPPFKSNMIQRVMTKTGWRWISWEDSVIMDEGGRPIEIQAIGYDITELKEIQISLKESNLDLENFAYVASHDLQDPLRKITAFESLLSDNIRESGGYVNEESNLYLRKISEAAYRMKNLIDDLLSFSRVSRMGIPFRKTFLTPVIYDVIDNILEERIKELNAKIEIFGEMPSVECDPEQIKQIFQNLISNSLKYSKKNKRPEIGISCKKIEKENIYLLSIEDNGIGFDQKYAEDIFRSFNKLHGRDEYPGSGIGLAICKRIAERHEWKISAYGEDGKGAKFEIRIPLYNGENYGFKEEKNTCSSDSG